MLLLAQARILVFDLPGPTRCNRHLQASAKSPSRSPHQSILQGVSLTATVHGRSDQLCPLQFIVCEREPGRAVKQPVVIEHVTQTSPSCARVGDAIPIARLPCQRGRERLCSHETGGEARKPNVGFSSQHQVFTNSLIVARLQSAKVASVAEVAIERVCEVKRSGQNRPSPTDLVGAPARVPRRVTVLTPEIQSGPFKS